MSQRKPASRSASPRTSTSPPIGTNTSPNSQPPELRGGGNTSTDNGPSESGGIPRTNGELLPSFPPRGLGVRNILNPAEVQPSAGRPEGSSTTSTAQLSSSGFESGRTTPQPFPLQGHGMAGRQPTNPSPGGQPSLGPPPTDHGSPASTQSFPALAATRRILTPRSPRASSVGHGPVPRSLNPQPSQYYSVAPAAQSRGFPSDHPAPGQHDRSPRVNSPQPLAPHFGRAHPPGGVPPTSLAPLATPPRSLSQPTPGQFNAPAQEPRHPQGRPGSQIRPHAIGSTSPYPAAMQHGNRHSLPAGDSMWPGGLGAGSQTGPSTVRGIAESALSINPLHGESFIVPIDVYQGSRQADEKRQRNAGASARFRARKKDKEIQQSVRIQELETQNRELERRRQDAENERDRYRTERDRLRDIVYRTPGISELAFQGPPSPISTRSGGSFAERSPLAPAPPPPPMHPYGVADPITGERATRRRRTDPQLEFIGQPYGPGQTTLPPIPPSSYGTPLSQPGTPSAAARTSRLPPLRLDQPAGPPTTGPSTSSTPVQSFPPFKREYESGWATRSSGPHNDPGQH
ncbi:hypothetical protein F4779DRAFT_206008 [Xylariaceae sp. FL0662B]|nr:hypothetical protein F4779DRAFT_206008 [Xylariaceae sp. FL0662B]